MEWDGFYSDYGSWGYDAWSPSPYAWDWSANTSYDAWNNYWSSAFDYASDDYSSPSDLGATHLPPIEVAASNDYEMTENIWNPTPSADRSAQSLGDIYFSGTPIVDPNNGSNRFSLPTVTSPTLSPSTDWIYSGPFADYSEQVAQQVSPPQLSDPNFEYKILNNGLSSEFPPGFFGPFQNFVDDPARLFSVPGSPVATGITRWLVTPEKAY